MHWLAHLIGLDNGAGGWYLFWSGFGANFGELAIIGAAYGMLRKHNCHNKGCWRVGRHVVDGTPWCNRHHEGARAAAGHDIASLRKFIHEGQQAIHRRLDDHADLIRAANTKGK